jgi:HEPN domain-containing protein
LYYLTARYPDALPEHAVPSERFNREMANDALKMAQAFLALVTEELNKAPYYE